MHDIRKAFCICGEHERRLRLCTSFLPVPERNNPPWPPRPVSDDEDVYAKSEILKQLHQSLTSQESEQIRRFEPEHVELSSGLAFCEEVGVAVPGKFCIFLARDFKNMYERIVHWGEDSVAMTPALAAQTLNALGIDSRLIVARQIALDLLENMAQFRGDVAEQLGNASDDMRVHLDAGKRNDEGFVRALYTTMARGRLREWKYPHGKSRMAQEADMNPKELAAKRAVLDLVRDEVSDQERDVLEKFTGKNVMLDLAKPHTSLKKNGCWVSMQLQKDNFIDFTRIDVCKIVSINFGTEDDGYGALFVGRAINRLSEVHREAIARSVTSFPLAWQKRQRREALRKIDQTQGVDKQEAIGLVEREYRRRRRNILLRYHRISSGGLEE